MKGVTFMVVLLSSCTFNPEMLPSHFSERPECPGIVIPSMWALILERAISHWELDLVNKKGLSVYLELLWPCTALRGVFCELEYHDGWTYCWDRIQAFFHVHMPITLSVFLHKKPCWLTLSELTRFCISSEFLSDLGVFRWLLVSLSSTFFDPHWTV